MDKQCSRCKRVLAASEFYQSNARRDGLSSWCVDCGRAANAVSHAKLRQAVIEQLGGKCRSCDYSADMRALTIDHVCGDGAARRRDGSGHTSRLLYEALYDTIGRYQLLCCNCNSIKRIVENECGVRVHVRSAYSGPLMTKWCPRCKSTKKAVDFCCNAARGDGLSSYCARCRVEDQVEKYQAHRLQVIAFLGGCCGHCGYDVDDKALVIDHVLGGGGAERKAGIAGRTAFRTVFDSRNAGKYQLLCANCNIIKRFDQEERGNRIYERVIPTERLDRPNLRWTPEARAAQSERTKSIWRDPEIRARLSKARSESMKRRWASGEVPCRRKSTT